MCMSIRMKEWGMMSLPSRGVHMSTEGLTGWGEAARRTGEGISAALDGAAHIMRERARVSAAGELADFSDRLRAIDQETRDELVGQDVQDWNYAWQRASAPKLAEAIDELSPASRLAGQQLAYAYNAQASVEAQRDHELQKIDKARAQWRRQVDQAVQEGDAQEAQQWLQAGQGIFVSSEDMAQQNEALESKAHLSRWQRELQESPLRTLSAMSEAQESELPRRKADTESLTYAKRRAGRAARHEVLETMRSCLENEQEPDPEYMRMAVRAGVLTQAESDAAQEKPAALSYEQRRDWMSRVDECEDDDDAAEDLMLRIAAAPMPAAERRSLLKRVEVSRSLPVAERRSMSRSLRELYRDGVLGCPGDDAAQKRFAELQQGSLELLAQGGAQAVGLWVQGLRDMSDRWVCFDPQIQQA